MKIAIAIPTRGYIFAETIECIQAAIAKLKPGYVVLPDWSIVSGLPIPDAHNAAAKRALATDAELIWFIEEDNGFVTDTLNTLVSLIEIGFDWAFANYPVGGDPIAGTGGGDCYHYSHSERRVLWTGTGCTLIKREVFEAVGLFRTDTMISIRNFCEKNEILKEIDRPENYPTYGQQDILFGWDATRKGFKIAVSHNDDNGWQYRLDARGVAGVNAGSHTIKRLEFSRKRREPRDGVGIFSPPC